MSISYKAVWRLLTWGDKVIASFLLLVSLLSFAIVKALDRPGQIALITVQNGQKFSKNLSQNEKFFVSGQIGETTIEVFDGTIKVISSDCPQKLCVRQGGIRQTGEIIVCVPNRLTISIMGTRKNKFDAITG